MKFIFLLIQLLFYTSFILGQNKEELIQYVDPFIGTGAHGHTFPGATVPFGMLQVSPTNDFKNWDWCSGYHYSDTVIKGFAHNHLSGTGLAGLGDILLMPTTGQVKVNPGDEKDPSTGYRSRFSHQREDASAGYYEVVLDDYDIKVELTCSERVGLHRYTFPESSEANIIIDPNANIMENVFETYVKIVSKTEIGGYKYCSGEGGERYVNFIAKFSKPFKNSGVVLNKEIQKGEKETKGESTKAFVTFDTKKGEQIEVKVALSYVSFDGARANLNTLSEKEDFNFVYESAKNKWENVLNKIVVEGTEKQKRIFYTGMYHSFIAPNLLSDADGKHLVENQFYESEINQYSTFSTWDTFRALHPLFTIIEPEKDVEFVNSLISRYSLSKVGLPIWELTGHDNFCMIGHNTVPIITDAIVKELPGIDAETALAAMIDASNNTLRSSSNYGNNGIEEYLSLGYVPGGASQSVSLTLEYVYYDWCIYRTAKFLGDEKVAAEYLQRAKAYVNLFNEKEKYFWPKNIQGEWMEVNWESWDELISHYVSGNVWGYSTFLPHAIPHLIELQGGKEEFIEWLDSIIDDDSVIKGGQHVDISGFIGKYGHGDEPSQQFPYLYSFAGQPWKTQKIVRQVMDQFYNDTPDGLINNEDCGQMSAWYIFNAMGFYPVCPGDGKYIIGSPVLKHASINLPNGNKFRIDVKNNSEENVFVQSVILNGEDLHRSYILHKEIVNGGSIEFIMGKKPNKTWASNPENCPDYKNELKIYDAEPFSFATLPIFEKESIDVFADEYHIKLYCNSPGARIYYTTDGSEPIEYYNLYKNEIIINDEALLKAKAFSEGKPPSLIFQKQYYTSITAEKNSEIKIIDLKENAYKYGEEDGSLLLNSQIGSIAFHDGKWSAWFGKDLDITIDLGELRKISEVTIGILTATGSWIFSPKSILVEGGLENNKMNKFGQKLFAVMENEYGPELIRHKIKFDKQKCRYLHIFVENTGIIPRWHGGHDTPAWLFVDEIFIK